MSQISSLLVGHTTCWHIPCQVQEAPNAFPFPRPDTQQQRNSKENHHRNNVPFRIWARWSGLTGRLSLACVPQPESCDPLRCQTALAESLSQSSCPMRKWLRAWAGIDYHNMKASVPSSRIRRGGFLTIIREMAILCFSPPLMRSLKVSNEQTNQQFAPIIEYPRSPTIVSKPVADFSMNGSSCAFSRAE